MSEVEHAHSQGSPEMSPPVSRKLRELFLEAAEIQDAAARAAFLDRVCGEDAGLRRRVEELLAADQAAGPAPPQAVAPDPRRGEGVGSVIGRYKLLQQIGEGGCGIVYMAEQVEPVRRQVALKIIKLGMDTKSVVARFEAERQALALMDHPNIAKVHDAGSTEAGRPYFVMELVRGIKITDYCDQQNLSTRQRLDLFVQVCDAVQHAHQKGVIHRDLKPSNILVTQRDGVPVPKVIDFGIAKAITDQRLTDKTLYTAFEQFLGTPAYMSPEQAELSELGTDTRSDIYSLGVLLYELLTGSTPFDTQELLKAGLDEMRRTIREEEPPTPSSRLTQLQSPAVGGATAKSKIKNQKSKIPADLDWIVMKCLEKDRARRYATANGLAVDIGRHLKNEPVVARPPSRLYELQKTVRRHKFGFAAAGAVVVALSCGVVGSTWQAVRARRAERQAQTEATKSQQVAKFLEDTLAGLDPAVAQGRDTTLLREILDQAASRVTIELKNQPVVAAELQEKIADAYVVILEFTKAEQLHRQALETRRKLLGLVHPDVGRSLLRLAATRRSQDSFAEAEAMDREAATIYRKLGHPGLAEALSALAVVLEYESKFDEAQIPIQDALALLRRTPGDHRFQIAYGLAHLGSIRRGQGRLAEAENLLLEQIPAMREVGGGENLFFTLEALSNVLLDEAKLPAAEEALREELTIARRIYHDTHPPYLAKALSGLSGALAREGKFEEEEALLQEALSVLRKAPGDHRSTIAETLGQLATLRRHQGRKTEAESILKERLTILREVGTSKDLLFALEDLADFLSEQGKRAQADDALNEGLTIVKRAPQDVTPRDLAGAVNRLSIQLVGEGRLDEAEALEEQLLAILQKATGDQRLEMAQARFRVGWIRSAQGNKAEAEKVIRAQLPTLRQLAKPEQLLWPLGVLGNVLVDQGESAKAEDPYREILTIARRLDRDPNHRQLVTALSNLSGTLLPEGKLSEAEALQREAVEVLRKGPMDERSELAKGLTSLSGVLEREGKSDEAAAVQQEAFEVLRNSSGDHRLEIAKMLQQIGDLRFSQGRTAEAEKLIVEQLPIVRELGAPADLSWALGRLGYLLMEEGKLARAEEAFREGITIERGGSNLHYILSCLLGLADCLWRERKLAASLTCVREAVAIERGLTEDQRAQYAEVAAYTASVLERNGDLAEAEVWYRQALLDETRRPRMAPGQYAQVVINLVTVHFPQKRFHELEASYPEWLQQVRARVPADDPALADILAQVIIAPLEEHKFEEAEQLARECLTIREKKQANDWSTYEARGTLGSCLVRQKRYAEAEPLLLSGCQGLIQHASGIPDGWKPRANTDLDCLVELYNETGRPYLAAEWAKQRQEFNQAIRPQQSLRADDAAKSER